jgi:hypothetical protein
VRRSPTVRAHFERVQRGDPERKKIALVAMSHYLVRVRLALLKRGTTWEEAVAPADEPKRAVPTAADGFHRDHGPAHMGPAGRKAVQVEIESGTQVASLGPTWRNATPRC